VAHSCGETETALKLHGAASAHLEAGGASAAGSSGRRHRAEREVLSTDESLDVDHLYNAGRQMHVDQALALATEFAARQGKLRPADSSVICS